MATIKIETGIVKKLTQMAFQFCDLCFESLFKLALNSISFSDLYMASTGGLNCECVYVCLCLCVKPGLPQQILKYMTILLETKPNPQLHEEQCHNSYFSRD